MAFILKKAGYADIKKVKIHAEKLNLDSEELNPQKLYIIEKEKKLVGFGRHKNYGNIHELSTVGILEPYRRLRLGQVIVEKLISLAPVRNEIWLTTIFPEYFAKFGFKTDKNIPEELILKAERICKKFNKSPEYNTFMKYHKILKQP